MLKSAMSNEVFIVLANLMDKNGELNKESKKRVDELIRVIGIQKNKNIFFCGWAYREDSDKTIASAQKKYFESNHRLQHKIFLIEDSRDTVGDAVFSRILIDNLSGIDVINVITSDYHIERTSIIFNFVFGKTYKIKMISAKTDMPKNYIATEKESMRKFQETFSGIMDGDIDKISSTMYEKHPFYNGEVYKLK